MTELLTRDGGTIAYEVSGSGPLIVLAHGMGDSRASYRFVAPALVSAGYRVAALDLRGCGESSSDWPAYTRTDIAGDLVALVRHLGGPAVLVGHSISGGAVTIAAAQEPDLIEGIVELAPFTRKQSISLGDLRVEALPRRHDPAGAGRPPGQREVVALLPRRRVSRPEADRLGRPAATQRGACCASRAG